MTDTGSFARSTSPADRLVVDRLPCRVSVLPDEPSLLLHYLGSMLAAVFDGRDIGEGEGGPTQQETTKESS